MRLRETGGEVEQGAKRDDARKTGKKGRASRSFLHARRRRLGWLILGDEQIYNQRAIISGACISDILRHSPESRQEAL